jgi:hypothetical protein
MIQFRGCITKRKIARTFFLDQAFKATKTQKILKEVT